MFSYICLLNLQSLSQGLLVKIIRDGLWVLGTASLLKIRQLCCVVAYKFQKLVSKTQFFLWDFQNSSLWLCWLISSFQSSPILTHISPCPWFCLASLQCQSFWHSAQNTVTYLHTHTHTPSYPFLSFFFDLRLQKFP